MSGASRKQIRQALTGMGYRDLQSLAKRLKRHVDIKANVAQKELAAALCKPNVLKLLKRGRNGEIQLKVTGDARDVSSDVEEPEQKVMHVIQVI